MRISDWSSDVCSSDLVYAELVQLHTTLKLTPEEVHARGHERMREVRSQMRALLDEMAFEGDPQAYLEELTANPKWRAGTTEGMADGFPAYNERKAPEVGGGMRYKPNADNGVRPHPHEQTG